MKTPDIELTTMNQKPDEMKMVLQELQIIKEALKHINLKHGDLNLELY